MRSNEKDENGDEICEGDDTNDEDRPSDEDGDKQFSTILRYFKINR